MILPRSAKFSSPAKLLIISNILTIFFAVLFQWSVLTLMWGYWIQSVIIGVFTVIKLFMFGIQQNKTTVGLGSIGLSFFFMIHYGGFHFGYAIFLMVFSFGPVFPGFSYQQPDVLGIILIGSIFFINHTYSFVKNYIWEKKSIGSSAQRIFSDPYKRIIPMHLSIMAAAFFVFFTGFAETLLIVFFLLLKTVLDLYSHTRQHTKDEARV